MLGAPFNAGNDVLVDFLADELGAEAAALRLMEGQDWLRTKIIQ